MTKHVCSCCTSGRLTCTSFFLFLFSLALISVGFFIPSVIDKALDDGITDFLALTPEARSSGSQGYVTWADWTDSRAPVVYYSVYTFNLTNPDQVLKGGKPNVTQIGPYVYREYKKKLNTNFSVDEEGHATVKYQDYVYYIYDAERSGPHLNPMTDRIYTINFIFEALKGVLGDAVWIFFDDLIDPHWNDKTRLFHEFIVNDFIWGYNDTLLWEVSCLQKCQTFPGVLTNITEEMIPTILHDTIYTGDGTDPALMRSYVKWQEMDYIGVPIDAPTQPLWNTPAANHVHGTDGTQFARNLVKGQPIVAFVSELYRAATLKNIDGAVNSYKGIDLLHFTLDPMLLANSTVYPPSADYNINGPSGMLHIGRAVQNLPIVLTKPHFLDVGAPVNNLTIGLTPNREMHDTFIDVEPTTGAAMNAAKRLQINIQLENVHYPNWPKTWFEHVNNQTLVPIVWVEEAGALSDSQAHDFKSQVYMAQTARYYVKWVGYIAGICFAFLAVALFLNAKTRARTETMKSIQSGDDLDRYEPLINPSGYAQ